VTTKAAPPRSADPMRNDPSRHWGAIVPFVPAEVLVEQARALESAGLIGVLAPQVYGPPFVPLAAVAAGTATSCEPAAIDEGADLSLPLRLLNEIAVYLPARRGLRRRWHDCLRDR
jgi:hypothetical protein